jgi:hypothetical protein
VKQLGFTLFAAAVLTLPLCAQVILRADIPFEFRVGTNILQAGRYDVRLSFNHMQGLLNLACHACEGNVSVGTNNVTAENHAGSAGKLVFEKYGDQYFLSSVWSPGGGEASALPKSKTEREIARNGSPGQTIEVVLARR